MSLRVISGPPGSGRGSLLLAEFVAALDRDPILVAPTSDDVDRLERELCEMPGGILGGSVTSFPGLFREVGRGIGLEAVDGLSGMQRIWLCRSAVRLLRASSGEGLRRLARSAQREGFAPALERLLGELQAAGHDAVSFAAAVEQAEAGEYEREIASLFAAYERERDRVRLVDDHQLAARVTTGLRADPRAWPERPVLLYGFDDLTREQIELVGALSRACEVTATVTHEHRHALSARAELLGVLRDELGADVTEVGPAGDGAAGGTLAHLERGLFEPGAGAVPVDGSIRVLEGAGDRGEAELVGRRIAGLLADGADPDDIAIAVRSPDRQAPLIARTLGALGIPVAPESSVPLGVTATGAAIGELLAIFAGEADATTVVSLLRRPGRARPEQVDWLERSVLRERMQEADEALDAWAGDGPEPRRIFALADLRETTDFAGVARVLSRFAADVAERPHRRSGIVPSGSPAVELRAASEVARALNEVLALGDLAPADPAAIAELLAHVRVPLWRGATEGRVRILSPYRLRATRVEHLFVAGLSDGSFPASGGTDPLLSDDRRRELGLPSRTDPAAEERYLFYTCVAKPTTCLHLSYPASDEAGGTAPRSPFVDEVRDLLSPTPAPGPDPVEAEITDRAGLADFVCAPAAACASHDLARALAAPGIDPEEHAAALVLPDGAAERALSAIGEARERLDASREPGPISHPDVLATMAGQNLFGASTLEEFHRCSYRWFVNHELKPRRIGPDPEPLEQGGIVHEALERLYREQPEGERRPSPETVGRWIERALAIVREVAADRGWNLETPTAAIALARFDPILARFLRRDASFEGALAPDPDLLELRFGNREGDVRPPAAIGDFELRGAIDRIDVAGNHALIRDYKLSASVVAGKKLVEEGKLQLPLYILAARTFGLDPIGGLYSPLAATEKDRPRGLIDKEFRDDLVPGETSQHYGTDFFEPEKLEEILDEALAEANRVVGEIRAGAVTRNPRGNECPTWCTLAPVCRIERGVPWEDEDTEELEEAMG